MKLAVLVDNNTLIDRYYLGEPGFSVYLEDNKHHILFDTGYSDAVVRNAKKMHIHLDKIDTIVFSHGHNDHTGGMRYLSKLSQEIYLISHPDAYNEKHYEGLDVSMPVKHYPANFHSVLSKNVLPVSDHLLFLGEIPRLYTPLMPLEDDPLYDDSALVYEKEEGFFLITGCSHSGIINICEYAKQITAKSHILGIIGGFHIQNNPDYAKEVADYFSKEDIDVLYPCHCTDLQAKIELSRSCKLKEVGVSMTLEI